MVLTTTDGTAVRDADFTAFVDAEYAVVVRALTLWCGDRSVAEEVTSEAFARAYRDWRRVRDLDAPGAWVRRVAINVATSRFRRRGAERRATRRLQGDARLAHHDPDGADVLAVRAALQRLTPDQRTVLVLRYYLDLPIREVAEVTGRSPSAVTSLANRAAAALRADLGGIAPSPPRQEAHDG